MMNPMNDLLGEAFEEGYKQAIKDIGAIDKLNKEPQPKISPEFIKELEADFLACEVEITNEMIDRNIRALKSDGYSEGHLTIHLLQALKESRELMPKEGE